MCVQSNASTATTTTGVSTAPPEWSTGVLSTGTFDHFFVSPQVTMQLGPSLTNFLGVGRHHSQHVGGTPVESCDSHFSNQK